jgi:hypothetical protein
MVMMATLYIACLYRSDKLSNSGVDIRECLFILFSP